MRKLSILFFVAVIIGGALGGAPTALASGGSDQVYYATCPQQQGGCPLATTLFFNGWLDKANYAPGDPIYFTVSVDSDDNPQPTTGVSPVAYGTVPGGAKSADLFPGTYTPNQIRAQVQSAKTLIGNAPATPGNYTVAVSYSSGGYGTVTDTIAFSVVVQPNSATCSSLSAPSVVGAGQSFTASITMNNNGGTTWTSASNYNLGSQNAQDNTTWGTNRIALPSSVAPGGSVTFSRTFTAPTTAGAYTFSWGMVQDFVAWFGTTCSQGIRILPPEPTFSATCAVQANGTYNVALSWNAVTGATNYPVRLKGPGLATATSPSYPIGTTDGTDNIVGWGVVGDAPTSAGSPGITFTGITAVGSYQYWGHAWSSTGGWSTDTPRTVTCAPAKPTVTTSAVPPASITQTSANSGGTVTSNGGATVTPSGIVWGTALNPTTLTHTGGGITTDGWAIGGPWTDAMTGLSAGTTYHVRAYATNSAGTSYGADVAFTTAPSTDCSATTINNCSLATTVNGGSSGTCTLSGTCKYTCSSGTWVLNSNLCAAPVAPTVTTTNPITSITSNSASGGGTVNSDGGATVTTSGIVWGTSANPTTALATKTTDGWAIGGPWVDAITGLNASTLYHVRAYATNSVGTSYGADVTFTTAPPAPCTGTTVNSCALTDNTPSGSTSGACTISGTCTYTCSNGTWVLGSNACAGPTVPTVTTTNPVTNITSSSADGGGTVNSNGGATVTTSGIVWGTSVNPTTGSHAGGGIKTDGWAIGGPWVDSMTGLIANRTYHVRAYATNSAGTAYGSDVSFTTSAGGGAVPTATLTANPTSINPGQTSRLTWSSTNATSCTFADTGVVATSGNRNVSPAVTSNYSITCSGAGGTSAPALATVTVLTPTLSITATPARVKKGNTSTIAWTASNVFSCTVTKNGAAWKNGRANGSGVYSGSSLETINAQTTYVMACTDVNRNAYATTAVSVVNIAPAFQEF
jgi:hypothetical protein